MEKENQRVTVTKRMLQEGLLRLLEKKPLDKVSVTELCREAGINRVTFYRHYALPHDVLLDMEQDLLAELKSSLKMPRTKEETRAYLQELCAFFDARIPVFKIMIRNNSDSDFYALFHDLFLDTHRSWSGTPLLRELDPEALSILSIYSAGGGYFLMRQWLLGNLNKTPYEIADVFYDLLCNTDWADIGRRYSSAGKEAAV